jgi:hypothetical protein
MTVKTIILAAALIVGAISAATVTTTVTWANAPGGAYIQCDARNPSSPVRCTPDGW